MPPLPPAREFLTSAGFGGAAALLAAIVVAVVAIFAARGAAKRHRRQLEQRERHHQEMRADERREAAVTRCWQRFAWVVETAGLEPASEAATLGLGPELTLEILRGLLRDAEQLGDDTLTGAVTVHLNQFSLVLAQQSGSLTRLAAASSSASALIDGQHDEQRSSAHNQKPSQPQLTDTPAADEPTAARQVTERGRRR
ncbi:hypothetical protein MSM1_20620 [Mycobacterium sp. SM1]|nr:hypothetical protein [Mycobacterium sp. SM1]